MPLHDLLADEACVLTTLFAETLVEKGLLSAAEDRRRNGGATAPLRQRSPRRSGLGARAPRTALAVVVMLGAGVTGATGGGGDTGVASSAR